MTQTVDHGPSATLPRVREVAESFLARVNEERPLLRPRLLQAFERLARRQLHKRGIASRFVETSVGKVHVVDGAGRGTLPPIVLLHGITASVAGYTPLLSMLQKHTRRIVAIDAPGHGFSEAPRVRFTGDVLLDSMTEVLDQVINEPAVVIGNSLGGAIALHYAGERPSRVRGLALLSPAGAPWTEDELRELIGKFTIKNARDAHAFFHLIYHRQPWFVRLLARDIVHSVNRRAPRELFESAEANAGATPEQLAALKMPILLWWGRSERLLPSSNLRYFREHFPAHAVIEEPEGIGHCPHLDNPRATCERLVAFTRAIGD